MVVFDLEKEVKELSKAEEIEGKLSNSIDPALMKSVLEADKKTIDDGKIVEEAANRGIGGFTPDLLFEQLVKNYSTIQQLYGEKLLQLITGFNGNYLQKNIRIPEFQKLLKKNISEKQEEMHSHGLMDDNNVFTQKGVQLASIVLLVKELEHLMRGFKGMKGKKEKAHHGEPVAVRAYRKGDLYRNIAIRQTIKTAIKRKRDFLQIGDLKTFERERKGSITLIYAVDASASMKGKKIEMCKRAGVALAFQAVQEKDDVGLIVFGKDVKDVVEPTQDFGYLLQAITKVRASMQTQFVPMIERAIELFPADNRAKHLIILSDALPTVGEEPEKETLKAISFARANGITVSLLGIQLDQNGKKFAEQIVKLGEGRFINVKEIENLDFYVLEDYWSTVGG
ncbi:VWA domain-containing protein [Candidatus Woesearchaeota archaeon]|nr:VWA domain-containing protein [Candidatus Woesearchaeota archaeon]